VTPASAQTSIKNARALSGDRFVLGEEEFELADIIAPPLYTLGAKPSAYFEPARHTLQIFLSGGVEVEDVAEKTRWGVRVVTAKTAGLEETLQEALVARGAVRVAPLSDDTDLIVRLLEFEKTARESRLGLWGLNAYRIFDAARAEDAIGGYNLIEGAVKRATKTRQRFYLNFGEDYKTDFTAGAVSRIYRRWTKVGFDLAELEGARVRIRGFVDEINGPSIDLKHPKQIELLSAETV
jgi:endonuclease YncB( thermonuclease family)